MGLDLMILVPNRKDSDICSTVLSLKRDVELFEKIEYVSDNFGDPIPKAGIWLSMIAVNDKKIKKDHYGNPLRILTADRIKLGASSIKENAYIFNYLKHLPDDYPLILYWF